MRQLLLLAAALGAAALPVPASARAESACPANLAGELASTGTSGQLVTVVAGDSGSTIGALSLWRRAGGCWRLVAGPWIARLGSHGISTHHREGDGTTPEGAYGIGAVMYGVAPDPGVAYSYRRLVCGDWWDEDPRSDAYNSFVQLRCGQSPRFGAASEALWLSPTAYAHFALIDYNTHPVVVGAGSAIFLHVASGRPTDGCVALPAAELVTVLRWLRASQSPLIAIGTSRTIRGF